MCAVDQRGINWDHGLGRISPFYHLHSEALPLKPLGDQRPLGEKIYFDVLYIHHRDQC